MKITEVEAFAIRYPLREPIQDATHDLSFFELAVVRIHTDDGLVGHGFSPASHGGAAIISALTRTMITPILLGRDPFHVRGLWDEMFWLTQIVGRAGVNRLAMGAVDIALWDLNARALGVPLWKLLGGTGATRFPLYSTDAGWASFLQYLVAAGREVESDFAPQTVALLAELSTGAEHRDAALAMFLRELPSLVASAPAALVLDDYHLVDHVPEIREFMRILIARAPKGFSVVLLARRVPSVPISRLRAMGEVAELRSHDLRFQLDETERLFRDAYHRAVEPDVLQTLAERTDGWAASLQLVDAALRDRPSSEVRSFVQGLTGARGDLYDYLAEEVVGDLGAETQRFLMRTSILQSVNDESAVLVTGLDARRVSADIASVERLGLLARRGAGGQGHRYHPLVREFLEARLRVEVGEEAVADLHRTVAVAYEERNWRISAHHYAAIDATGDVSRLLISNAPRIMGSGEFDVAKSFVDKLDAAAVEPVFDLFLSRVDLDQGNLDSALSRAESAYALLKESDTPLRHLALANLASVNYLLGDLNAAWTFSMTLAKSDAGMDLLNIAHATITALESSVYGNLDEYRRILLDMAEEQRKTGRRHYLAITLLNVSMVAKSQGRAKDALRRAKEAEDLLQGGSAGLEYAAAVVNCAWALAHLGRWDEAQLQMRAAMESSSGLALVETLVESAGIWIWYASHEEADALIQGVVEQDRQASRTLPDLLPVVLTELRIRQGRLAEARGVYATQIGSTFSNESGRASRIKFLGVNRTGSDGDPGDWVSSGRGGCS